jgi:hypothetical protein
MTTANTWEYAWENAQRGCFEYFNKLLGTLEGISAHTITTYPPVLPDLEDKTFIWKFTISGGPITVFRQTRKEILGGAWKMNAVFEAVFNSEITARSVAGSIMNALPVLQTDVEGLARLYPVSWPEINRIASRVRGSENAGEEVLAYHIQINMECAFYNTERKQ